MGVGERPPRAGGSTWRPLYRPHAGQAMCDGFAARKPDSGTDSTAARRRSPSTRRDGAAPSNAISSGTSNWTCVCSCRDLRAQDDSWREGMRRERPLPSSRTRGRSAAECRTNRRLPPHIRSNHQDDAGQIATFSRVAQEHGAISRTRTRPGRMAGNTSVPRKVVGSWAREASPTGIEHSGARCGSAKTLSASPRTAKPRGERQSGPPAVISSTTDEQRCRANAESGKCSPKRS